MKIVRRLKVCKAGVRSNVRTCDTATVVMTLGWEGDLHHLQGCLDM
jgi:hypothetical protein